MVCGVGLTWNLCLLAFEKVRHVIATRLMFLILTTLLFVQKPEGKTLEPDLLEALRVETLAAEDDLRRTGRDGANCVLMLARSHGLEPTYDKLRPSQPVTIAEVQTAGRNVGLNLTAVQMTLDEAVQSGPFICYLEESVDGGGQFGIAMCNPDTSFVWVVLGATATLQQYSGDEFRRIWRGYGLAVQPSRRPWTLAMQLSVALLMGITMGSLGSYWHSTWEKQ